MPPQCANELPRAGPSSRRCWTREPIPTVPGRWNRPCNCRIPPLLDCCWSAELNPTVAVSWRTFCSLSSRTETRCGNYCRSTRRTSRQSLWGLENEESAWLIHKGVCGEVLEDFLTLSFVEHQLDPLPAVTAFGTALGLIENVPVFIPVQAAALLAQDTVAGLECRPQSFQQ